MNSTRMLSILGLVGMVLPACTADAPLGHAPQLDQAWPGMNDPDADPADFTGRIDVEVCDGVDNNGDGVIDEGCTGTCDAFTTRTYDFWATATCTLDGTATGFSPFPITLGSTETYADAAAVEAVLALAPGGDSHLKLRRQLLTMKLNVAYFGIGGIDVVDWNADGTVDNVDWIVAKADENYDAGALWYQKSLASQLGEMNALGSALPLWFDDTCVAAAEYCDGVDNDGDGLVDENCGCVEKCGDSYDNDFDGAVDEGCTACGKYVSRDPSYWLPATCVIDGTLGFDMLPITLGTSETYTTAAEVQAALAVDPGGDSLKRLRRQLLTAKLNARAFNSGTFLVYDWNGDGTNESMDWMLAKADTFFDSGYFWQRTKMADALRTVNAAGGTVPTWFRTDCATSAEFCDGIDNDGDGVVDEDCGCVEACDGYDNDFDGSVDEDFPAGCPTAEICDGIDNDGDGLIDEPDAIDAGTWYADDDSDTFGNPGIATTACTVPAGYVADGTDCDDTDATIYPGATDVCDGHDNNCNGTIDEDAPVYYADTDGDTYGDAASHKQSCSVLTGYVSDSTDCDDTDATVHPGGVDYCGDGIDSDCSGSEIPCYTPPAAGNASFRGESAGDDAGVSTARVGDVDGDGVDDVVIGARNNDLGGTDAGAAYLFYGPVTYSGEVSLANADLTLYGNAAGDKAGRTVIGGADIDGDGRPDVTIGAPNEDSGGSNAGAAYVFFGTSLSAVTDPTAAMSTADAIFTGRTTNDYLGTRTSYSELTGDSTVDLLLSVTGDSVGGADAGGIYIYAGPITAGTTSVSSGTWAARITGEASNDQVGLFVGTGGDFNGDGVGDLIVGVPRQDSAGTDAGATYLVTGPLTGTFGLASAAAKISGEVAGDKLGSAVSFAGDQDGDGYDEFFTTAPFSDVVDHDAGVVYMVNGKADVTTMSGGSISALASSTILGKEYSGQFGSSVEASGDHNGDGVNDMVTGANNDGPDAQGATYLFLGPVAGSMTWADAEWSLLGESAFDHAGSFVSYGGDLRGLGGDTIIIGAREADAAGAVDAGKVYLIFQAL